MIICIEGMDASGKATQSKVIADTLNAGRIAFPTYSEYPDVLTGPLIAEHLKEQWRACRHAGGGIGEFDANLDALVFQCCMALNKYETVPRITRAVNKGNGVILDRYWPSAYAYGGADGLPDEWLINIHKALPKPDLFFLLDVSYETALERRPDRRDRYEAKGKEFFDRIRARYNDLWTAPALNHTRATMCEEGSAGWIVLNGELEPNAITAFILDKIVDHDLP